MDVELWVWAAFTAFILALLALDLFAFHREAHEVSYREAAITSAVWIALGLAFAGVVWVGWGGVPAGEYLAGYLIEKSLSVDNIFVFALLFSTFSVPAAYQHRVLFWGVVGALIFRGIFIAAGAALLESFHWMIYVFGGLLLVTGVRMLLHRTTEVHPERNPVLRLAGRLIPMTPTYEGQRFFIRRNGALLATPTLVVLIAVETTDIVFAIDSIPAIFAVTDEPFLVFSSNAFAILGLRALYFLLAGMMARFRYLKVGLAAVLLLVGVKMIVSDIYHPPVWLSLGGIAAILGVAVAASLRATAPGAAVGAGADRSAPLATKGGSG